MSQYKLKFSTDFNIDADAEEQGLSFGDIATAFVLDVIKEVEKPFIDKIVELGYTLEQLKSGELNDVFQIHVKDLKVRGEWCRQHYLIYKDKEVMQSVIIKLTNKTK